MKIIPLSKREAWKMYNKNVSVLETESYMRASKDFILEKGLDYDYFNKSKRLFALALTKEESEEIEKTQKGRARKLLGSLYLIPIGFMLFGFYLSGTKTRFSTVELLVYSQACLLFGSFLVVKLFESFNLEKQAWNKMFEKYQINDWKESIGE